MFDIAVVCIKLMAIYCDANGLLGAVCMLEALTILTAWQQIVLNLRN